MAQLIRVVIAYPAALREERGRVHKALERVNAYNRRLADATGREFPIFMCSDWESDAYPGASAGGPQEHLDRILRISEADIFIGLVGTELTAGTEHEIREAISAWQARSKPDLWIYFRRVEGGPSGDADGSAAVPNFRQELSGRGVLFWNFEDADAFEGDLNGHLIQYTADWVRRQASTLEPVGVVSVVHAEAKPVCAEGITERLAPIDVILVRASPHTPLMLDVSVEVALGVNVTNRLIEPRITDAVAEVEHRKDGSLRRVLVPGGLQAPNSILFQNIPIRFTGSQIAALRIWGVRANASVAGCSTTGPVVIPAFLKIGLDPETRCCVYPEYLPVGVVLPGCFCSVRPRRNAHLCWPSVEAEVRILGSCSMFEVTLVEGFPGAFGYGGSDFSAAEIRRTADVSGPPSLFMVLAGVPAGVRAFVTRRDLSSGAPQCILVGPGATPILQARGFPNTSGSEEGITEVPGTDGVARAVWQCVGATATATSDRRKVTFGLVLTVPTGRIIPGGALEISGGLAPISTVTIASADKPVPRFIDVSVPHRLALSG